MSSWHGPCEVPVVFILNGHEYTKPFLFECGAYFDPNLYNMQGQLSL